jgi:hypothetical protein
MTIKLIKQDWLQEGTVWCSPDMYELLKARVEVGASLEPIDTTPIVLAEGVVEAIADAFALPPVELCASGDESCYFGTYGPNGEIQCRYCGRAKEENNGN